MALPLLLTTYGAIIAPGGSLSSSYTRLGTGMDPDNTPSAAIAGGVALGADTLAAIQMPATWTTAALTFQVSPDGGTTWCELYDDAGNEVTVTTPLASSMIVFASHPSSLWRGINMIKVRSGTAAAPVVQTPGATINLIGRPEIY